MSILKAKRFWSEATPAEAETGGWLVELDGRPVRTPAKTLMVLPTQGLAREVAAEWNAQDGEIDPSKMPFTRTSNSALDKVAVQHREVADMLAEYGGTDLLCYRATSPQELITRQKEAWDPVLDWAAKSIGARLQVGAGVMHVAQSDTALTVMRDIVRNMDDFRLAAFHDLVGISGSLILAFAAARDYCDIDRIWQLSRIDEDWQAEQWGIDEEAEEQAEFKRGEFLHAKRYFDFCAET
ncbi:ATP12 family chaperone protein [Thalassovita aquimarina]|uniref:ATPase n=1 Tax=Thalassovita aquimarina TaxID=2785917 RepID=A0ABS5HPD5_9RHOB|nr:ATP12 family protein [Thalassovita aquimarina]MBR9650822.1 ATPase [Thalassovita aquimarina]